MGKLTPEQAAKNRERQRRWRERAFRDPDGHLLHRVNLALPPSPADILNRLSKRYGLTKRELIERLLIAASEGQIDLTAKRAPAPGAVERPTLPWLFERASEYGVTDTTIAERVGCTAAEIEEARRGVRALAGVRDALVDLVDKKATESARALLSDRHADADDAHGTGKSHVNLDADGDTEATNADTAAEIEAGTDPEIEQPTDFTLAPSRLSKPERERLVLDAHRQGHGSRAIAKLTGIGESTARLILKRHGLANEQRAPMPD